MGLVQKRCEMSQRKIKKDRELDIAINSKNAARQRQYEEEALWTTNLI